MDGVLVGRRPEARRPRPYRPCRTPCRTLLYPAVQPSIHCTPYTAVHPAVQTSVDHRHCTPAVHTGSCTLDRSILVNPYSLCRSRPKPLRNPHGTGSYCPPYTVEDRYATCCTPLGLSINWSIRTVWSLLAINPVQTQPVRTVLPAVYLLDAAVHRGSLCTSVLSDDYGQPWSITLCFTHGCYPSYVTWTIPYRLAIYASLPRLTINSHSDQSVGQP